MIEVRRVTKTYGRRTAVDDLSFSVEPGIITGFLGPNGAGKSTTMRMILGLTAPSSGDVLVEGRPLNDFDRPLRTIGGLIDASWLHPNRSARSHLRWMAAYNEIPEARVSATLDLTGLTSVAKTRGGKFSLGMRQRLGVAGALLGDPNVLVLDEPLNGLDPEGIAWMKEMLRHLADEGKTVFLSSHLLSEISATCDHLVVIGRGRLIADSTISEFVAKSGSKRVRVRAAELGRLGNALRDRNFSIKEIADDQARPALQIEGAGTDEVGLIAAASGIAILELANETATLEEAFMEVTKGEVEFSTSNHANQPSEAGR
jgi:ABC-2 type transport system ATP-binding protein